MEEVRGAENLPSSGHVTYLAGHDGVGRQMSGLANGTSIARAQVLDDLQVLRAQI